MSGNQAWPEIQQAIEKQKRDLKLNGQKVSERVSESKGNLPDQLWSLDALTKLEISNIPSLLNLSPNIQKLINLKELIISDNQKLVSIPPEISRLPDLKTLILENNGIKELPADFGKFFRNLQVLNLSGNQLSSLNGEFAKMTELVTVNLNANQFTKIPAQIYKLHRISTLSFCKNLLESIEPEITSLSGLQTLDLSYNKLVEVPTVLGNVPKLKDLKLEGNPFKDKKFLKTLDGGKAKNIVQVLKKMAPKSKKEEEPEIEYRFKIAGAPDTNFVKVTHAQSTRPHILMVVVRGLNFNEEQFKAFIELQTEIHQNLCKKRTIAALGTHDMKSVKPPFLYDAVPPEKIKFVPLRPDHAVNGLELAKYFEQTKDQTMLKYMSLIDKEKLWPVLYDRYPHYHFKIIESTKEVMSLHPVMNSKYSQISEDTQDMLIECTSQVDEDTCRMVMNEFLDRFGKLMHADTSNQMILEQVKVNSENGHMRYRYPLESDIADICAKDEE